MTNRERIIRIVEKFGQNGGVPEADESLFESGYLDSFALPDVVGALETEFQIKIPDADLNPRKFSSIERMEEYVDSRL
jgi:acyl carrier protein